MKEIKLALIGVLALACVCLTAHGGCWITNVTTRQAIQCNDTNTIDQVNWQRIHGIP
jgi:hypothetical protein